LGGRRRLEIERAWTKKKPAHVPVFILLSAAVEDSP
jgi:hypothetical protein